MKKFNKTTEVSARQHAILEKLKKCDDEMSGQQLHRELQNGPSSMGLTTVYRHVRALQQKGLIRCRHLPTGEVLYTPVERDNHHMTCVDCGKTIILQCCPLRNINLPIDHTEDFNLLFHTLEFFGLCKNCNSKGQTN